MQIMATIKFLALYAFEVFVIVVVGVTLIAGLYQVVRDQVRSTLSRVRESRVSTPAIVRKSG